jgi:hypothetical protein
MNAEVAVAAGVFAAMCAAVLVRAPQLLEPDDYAYRASIVALSEGHVLLSNAQYFALRLQLSVHGGVAILQWRHLASGQWISQKNPGYPFFAVPFQWLHALRWAPLFYGALACAGLFYGARRWLGSWGGTFVVALYCTSGAALLFAWRPTIPTFTDASLIAAGIGLLLGVFLDSSVSTRRRVILGTAGLLALDGAVFIRYTDAVVLLVAVVSVIALARSCGFSRAVLLGWVGMEVLFGFVILLFNRLLYGGFLTTGYPSGLVTFSTSAVAANVERMPSRLLESMPMVVLALAGIAGIVVERRRREGGPLGTSASRETGRSDAVVALVLAFGWLALWGLYVTYTWTVGQTIGPGIPIHVVRFYVPVLGLIALLAAWALVRLPRFLAALLLVVLAGLGTWSYLTPSNHRIVERPVPYGPVSRPGPPSLAGALGRVVPNGKSSAT